MMIQWLSYRRKWHLLWFLDLLTVGIWAFFLYKSPSPFGKEGEASANAMFYMMVYGLLRAFWLFVLALILLFRRQWWIGILAAVHGVLWFLLYYLLSIVVMGAVGGH